jgi:hypothetical protein
MLLSRAAKKETEDENQLRNDIRLLRFFSHEYIFDESLERKYYESRNYKRNNSHVTRDWSRIGLEMMKSIKQLEKFQILKLEIIESFKTAWKA